MMHVLKLPANQCPVVLDGVGACQEVMGCGLVTAAKLQLLNRLPYYDRDQWWNWG